MIENAIRAAMRKVGTRTEAMRKDRAPAEALGTCPVCGECVRSGDDRVRAWQGKYAHSRCAAYRRRRDSQRVHDSFTTA